MNELAMLQIKPKIRNASNVEASFSMLINKTVKYQDLTRILFENMRQFFVN